MGEECFQWAGQKLMLHFLCDVGAKNRLSSNSATARPCHAQHETAGLWNILNCRTYRNPAPEDWVIANKVFGYDM